MDPASRKQDWMGLESCVAIWVEGASSRQRAVGTKGIWKWSGVAAGEPGETWDAGQMCRDGSWG